MKTKSYVFWKGLTVTFVQLILVLCLSGNANAVTLHVGNGFPYSTLTQATAVTQPGDTILVHAGTYTGGLSIANLQGTSSLWIYILTAPMETVIYNGGSNAWQLTDAAYLFISGFIFEQQTGNGFNIDDGGSYNTPSHHVIFDNCTFRNINATGNNDLLKMSGVDDFEIRNCIFLDGSAGGSGIDMVGCHDGLITECNFENQGSNSIQAKGGSRNVRIERNLFKNGGQRSLNLGGSTGLSFFRPIDAPYEAADLKVYANVFIGSVAPIAYVGCINTEVINNTFYIPTKWVIRILQETVDTSRFAPCGKNTFRNNIVYHDSQVTTDCNIGPNTDPQSFTFSNNLWFHSQNAAWAGPILPVSDVDQIIGQNPLFVNESADNFDLQQGSPAIGAGYTVSEPLLDYTGNNFNNPRSIGAFEGNFFTATEDIYAISRDELVLYPNPARTELFLSISQDEKIEISISDLLGQPIMKLQNRNRIDISNLSKGIYIISFKQGQHNQTQKFIKDE